MAWVLRGFRDACDSWESAERPDAVTLRLVFEWVAELLDEPANDATTVLIDQTSATRIGCAPGTRVLMRYTLDHERSRLIVHRLDTVPEEEPTQA